MQISNLSVDQAVGGGGGEGALPTYGGFQSFFGWFHLFYCKICFTTCKHYKSTNISKKCVMRLVCCQMGQFKFFGEWQG